MAAGTKAATETKTEAKAAFPPFEAEHFPSQLLWLAITFGAIYLFVSRVVVKRVGGVIAGRADRISRDLEEASAAKARADEMTEAYARSLAEARDKAQSLARGMRESTTRERCETQGHRSRPRGEARERRQGDRCPQGAGDGECRRDCRRDGLGHHREAHRQAGERGRAPSRRRGGNEALKAYPMAHLISDAEFWVAVAFVIFLGLVAGSADSRR